MPRTLTYNKLAKSYNELHKEEQLKKIKIILKNINLKKTDKVLDIGCGTAFYHSFFPNYTGIDNSKQMLNQSKANVIQANAEKIPFSDKSFDLVISITAIHNFKNIEKAIKEIKRVAKKQIVISVLKRSKHFPKIKKLLHKYFKNLKEIKEEKDIIFLIS